MLVELSSSGYQDDEIKLRLF